MNATYTGLSSEIGLIFNDQLRQNVESKLPGGQITSLSIENQQAYTNLTSGINGFNLAAFESWLGTIGIAATDQGALLKEYDELNEARKKLKTLYEDSQGSLAESITPTTVQRTGLERLILDTLQFDQSKFDSLVDQVGYSLATDMKSAYGRIGQRLNDNKKTVQTIKTTSDKIDSLFSYLSGLYTLRGNVTANGNAQAEGETKLDGTLLSTTYGLAAIPLDNDFGVMEWSQYIAINIRFAPFDNEAGKSAFKDNFLSRLSAVIGFLITDDLQFRGQKLENTRLGFKPVIGLNYALTKHLDIGTGIVSFLPESINNAPTRTTVRPFVSLSFDFNLFNYLIQKNSK